MNKYHVIFVLILLLTSVAIALPNNKGIERASISPGVIEPGFPPQLPESQLNKVIFIRYKPEFAKDKPCNGDGVCDADERGWCSDCKTDSTDPADPSPSTCYDFLSGSKPKWNWLENYHTTTLIDSSQLAVQKWNNAVSGNIFGALAQENALWGVYDYKNSVVYGNYSEEGVIGVTAIWYRGKDIYEYDILLDIDYFPGDMDLDTVVLHEFGHAAGMGDLYDAECVEEVMYGIYEGPKSELRAGDITGIQTLYK
jgi:hypothetical protein